MYVDDVIIEGHTLEDLLENLRTVVTVLSQNKVLVNVKKFQIGPRVECLGFVRSVNGFEVSPAKLQALREVRSPTNKRELKSVLGLLRYLQRHVPQLAVLTKPLNKLTSNKLKWMWTEPEEKTLREAILAAQGALNRSVVNWNAEFHLRHDASDLGLGGYLYQMIESQERIVTVISHAFKDNELKWSTIEKECFSLVFCVSKCKDYLMGRHFFVEGDHKPLMAIAKAVHRGEANGRVHRWFWLLSTFSFTYQWIAGKSNVVADSLSRAPFVQEDSECDDGLRYDCRLVEVTRLAKWSQSHLLLEDARTRIENAHQGPGAFHASVDQTLQNLRSQGMWWPRMSTMVKEFVETCDKCQKKSRLPAPKVPLQLVNVPSEPFQMIGIDLKVLNKPDCNMFRYILVCVDYYSKYVVVDPLRSKDADSVLQAFVRRVLWVFGVPRMIVSDGGGEFANNVLDDFLEQLRTRHFTTLPYRPSANGQVERVMEEINRRIRGWEKKLDLLAILPEIQYSINSAINRSTGYSPMRLLFGYQPLSVVNAKDQSFEELIEQRVEAMGNERVDAHERAVLMKKTNKEQFDRKHGVKEPQIAVGDKVLVKVVNPGKYQDAWSGPAEVICVDGFRVTVRKQDGAEEIRYVDELKAYQERSEIDTTMSEMNAVVNGSDDVIGVTAVSDDNVVTGVTVVSDVIQKLVAKDVPQDHAEGVMNLLCTSDERRSRRRGPMMADLDSRWTGGITAIDHHFVSDGLLWYKVIWRARKSNEKSHIQGILTQGSSAHGDLLKQYWRGVLGLEDGSLP